MCVRPEPIRVVCLRRLCGPLQGCLVVCTCLPLLLFVLPGLSFVRDIDNKIIIAGLAVISPVFLVVSKDSNSGFQRGWLLCLLHL